MSQCVQIGKVGLLNKQIGANLAHIGSRMSLRDGTFGMHSVGIPLRKHIFHAE